MFGSGSWGIGTPSSPVCCQSLYHFYALVATTVVDLPRYHRWGKLRIDMLRCPRLLAASSNAFCLHVCCFALICHLVILRLNHCEFLEAQCQSVMYPNYIWQCTCEVLQHWRQVLGPTCVGHHSAMLNQTQVVWLFVHRANLHDGSLYYHP